MTHSSPLGQNNPARTLQWQQLVPSPLARDFVHSWKHEQCLNQSDFEFNENSKHSSYSSWRETQENFLPSKLLVPGGFLLKYCLGLLLFLKGKRHQRVCADPTACCQQRKEELLLVSPFSSQPPAPTPPTACWTTWCKRWTCSPSNRTTPAEAVSRAGSRKRVQRVAEVV